MPVRNLVVIVLFGAVSLLCYEKAQRNRYATIFAEAMQIVERDFLDEVDERDLFEGAMDGMVERLDEHSAYISPGDYQRFQESLDQEFAGVGIIVEIDAEAKLPTVVYALPGKPADKAGLRTGDKILAIDGSSTEGLTINDSVKLMRGKQGEVVHLSVKRADQEQPTDISIKRDIIPIESVLGDTRNADGTWNYYLEENPRIGYIRLSQFGEHTATELRDALEFNGRDVDGLILDVRGNPGGLLKSAVEICDMFIGDTHFGGRIVSTRGRRGTMREEYTATAEIQFDQDLPIAVLINGQSASASEILAACLKDHERGIVVGERTWGKGTVQNIIPMEGGSSALKLTTASYWRPNGKDIHRGRDSQRKVIPYKADDPRDWGVRPSDGFEVILTDEQSARIAKQRRQRDYDEDPNAAKPNDDDDVEKDTDDNAEEGPVDDLQLRKAIEYLEAKAGASQQKA